jgi:predicted flap endonuclease-1-like 5' DNA nuclease
MSTLMSWLSCHWFPLLLGALAGWLLNRWLCKCNSNTTVQQVAHTPSPAPAAAPALTPAAAPVKAAEAPVAKAVDVPKPAAPKPAAPAAAVIDMAAAKKAGFVIKNANDLTVVEGIGPKINELFNNAGIKTFAQLAKQTVPQMRKILDDGGSRFRIANPSTWAQQSALAAENKWDELKKLQDKLSAGVKK